MSRSGTQSGANAARCDAVREGMLLTMPYPYIRLLCSTTACVSILLLAGGCGLLGDDHEDLEERCRAEARTIIHDEELWRDHVIRSNQNYLARKREFPETGRAMPEYVQGFEERFGLQLKIDRTPVDGKVNRDDLYILENGKIVAQLVDFVLPAYGSGVGVLDCTGLFPELYANTSTR